MAPPGQKLLLRLLREKGISQSQHDRAIAQAKRANDHAEEVLLSSGVMDEATLLKFKAGKYQTQFVSTDKLSKAAADKAALSFVPKKVAEKLNVFPILYDRKRHRLSVVAADFEEHDIVKQVQLVTGLSHVAAYVARPAAIRALQKKHYNGDAHAFASLGLQSSLTPQAGAQTSRGGSSGTSPFSKAPNVPTDGIEVPPASARRAVSLGPGTSAQRGGGEPPSIRPQVVPLRIPNPEAGALTNAPPIAQASAVLSNPVPALAQGTADTEELCRVFVALLEQGRGPLRGHSATVARMMKSLCERMGVEEQSCHAFRIAAYCHDLGKGETFHLTALNVAEYDGHRAQAKKTYQTGLSLLDAVTLPEGTQQTLKHLYERFDGEGFPDRLSGKDIPLGSRLLAVVETYCDLTFNSKNPFRRKLTPKEAWEALESFRGKVFDPDVVDLGRSQLEKAQGVDDAESGQGTVILVDSDPEGAMVLELRLMERGYAVQVARTALEALELVQSGVSAILSEVDVEPFDGFELARRMKESVPNVPFIFLTVRGDGASVKSGYAMGAVDYLVKPVQAEVVAAKLEQVLSKRGDRAEAAGVSGSLREMPLPDVIQILSNGRRSGTLTLRAGGAKGAIFFQDGALWDASFGTHQAAEAVYEMLALQDGEFSFSRQSAPGERQIQDSTEALLLEGMRRMDERGLTI